MKVAVADLLANAGAQAKGVSGGAKGGQESAAVFAGFMQADSLQGESGLEENGTIEALLADAGTQTLNVAGGEVEAPAVFTEEEQALVDFLQGLGILFQGLVQFQEQLNANVEAQAEGLLMSSGEEQLGMALQEENLLARFQEVLQKMLGRLERSVADISASDSNNEQQGSEAENEISMESFLEDLRALLSEPLHAMNKMQNFIAQLQGVLQEHFSFAYEGQNLPGESAENALLRALGGVEHQARSLQQSLGLQPDFALQQSVEWSASSSGNELNELNKAEKELLKTWEKQNVPGEQNVQKESVQEGKKEQSPEFSQMAQSLHKDKGEIEKNNEKPAVREQGRHTEELSMRTERPSLREGQQERQNETMQMQHSAKDTELSGEVQKSSTTELKVAAAEKTESAFLKPRHLETAVLKQVGDQIRLMNRDGKQLMVLRLDPAELGKVELRVEMEEKHLRIHMTVENEQVKGLLESRIPQLRELLEGQQVQMDKMEVAVNREKLQEDRQRNMHRQDRRGRQRKQQEENGLVMKVDAGDQDTGRRLGYNTLELIA
jgi:flagellar hook-length control protein FliK